MDETPPTITELRDEVADLQEKIDELESDLEEAQKQNLLLQTKQARMDSRLDDVERAIRKLK